ncbi:Glucose N-acetyltransferase 1 [Paramyrothecium foliicola]|nr:Glucose N-acetyltransferase 1 [Paramyrothecium foliicola]
MTLKRYRWIILAAIITFCALSSLFLYRDLWDLAKKQLKTPNHSNVSADANAGSKGGVSDASAVDWSRFAYTQYVTNSDYLCNSVMFFEALHRLSSRADRVMMYPAQMLDADHHPSEDAHLLYKARDEYNVKLVPIIVQHRDGQDSTWADSFTKLLAFNQTQYSRVLSIDSDSMLLQNMDELFLIPSVPVAMPRAYWLWPEKEILSSQVILIEPSNVEFKRIMQHIHSASGSVFDMEIVNDLYRTSALVLPHRPYDMLSGEFRGDSHTAYLGSDVERWDPVAAYSEAKLIHFSDWPMPKPWLPISEEDIATSQPACKASRDGKEDCTARIIWNSFYTDFNKKRQGIVNLLLLRLSRCLSPRTNVDDEEGKNGQEGQRREHVRGDDCLVLLLVVIIVVTVVDVNTASTASTSTSARATAATATAAASSASSSSSARRATAPGTAAASGISSVEKLERDFDSATRKLLWNGRHGDRGGV